MKHRQIRLNALTTFIQVICSAAMLFFLYRFLFRTIGIERLGIWSLVLATTYFLTLANQGLSNSIVRFVAQYAARENGEDVSELLQTAILSMGVALAVVSVGLYPIARWLLGIVLPPTSTFEAFAILPLALASLWLNIMEGLLQAGLAGHELIAQCNYLELGGSFSYLLLALALVPHHGLLGLAWAQAIQSAALLVTTWILLRRTIPFLPVFPFRWSRALFHKVSAYAFQFQIITASQAMREPVTKALIAKFGGLALTGFYDMAARCVITVRELIVQANQVLVPTVSHLQEREPLAIPNLYRESYGLVFFLALPAFASLVISSPLISRIWIGRYEPPFVEFVALLSLGWLVNVLSNPAYVVALGTGELRWVSAGCITTAILNVFVGFLAGRYLGGVAVVAAAAFCQASGYSIILLAHFVKNRMSVSQLLPHGSGSLLLVSFAAPAIYFCLFHGLALHTVNSLTAASAIPALLLAIFISLWVHPLRRRLVKWVLFPGRG